MKEDVEHNHLSTSNVPRHVWVWAQMYKNVYAHWNDISHYIVKRTLHTTLGNQYRHSLSMFSILAVKTIYLCYINKYGTNKWFFIKYALYIFQLKAKYISYIFLSSLGFCYAHLSWCCVIASMVRLCLDWKHIWKHSLSLLFIRNAVFTFNFSI